MDRRHFIRMGLGLIGAATLPSRGFGDELASAVESAHAEIWRRFVDKHDVILDFTALDGSVPLPTPDECRDGKPNALGWFTPIENGAMFTGLYMDAAVNRWRHTKAEADATKARRLMEGLLLLASVSDVRGFVARGCSTDGRSHYAMGSDDQTLPWFLGLWRYVESDLATDAERERITVKLLETATAIVRLDWALPAESPFGRRGSFAEFRFDSASRLLFVAKMMHAVTGDSKWDAIYRRALTERGGHENSTRLEICERGMVFWYAPRHSWTSCGSVGALRGLWELEQDAVIKAAFARGLEASAERAAASLPLAAQLDLSDQNTFDANWRAPMMPLWKPQKTEMEAQALAMRQLEAFVKVCRAGIRKPRSCGSRPPRLGSSPLPPRRRASGHIFPRSSACWLTTTTSSSTTVASSGASPRGGGRWLFDSGDRPCCCRAGRHRNGVGWTRAVKTDANY
jgi:hypothetical protein